MVLDDLAKFVRVGAPQVSPDGAWVAVGFDQADPSTWKNTPRNAPCPCGSGKKYKHCHGKV